MIVRSRRSSRKTRSRFQARKDDATPAPTTQGRTTYRGFFAPAFFGSKVPEKFSVVAQHIYVFPTSYPAPSPHAKSTGGIFQLGPSSVSGPLILRKSAFERLLDNVNDETFKTICHLSAWRGEGI